MTVDHFEERGVGMKRAKVDYIEYIGGILLLTLGVALSSRAGLGTGSLDSINFALAKRTGLSGYFNICIDSSTEASIKTINSSLFNGCFY